MLTKFHLLNDRHACFSMSKYICTLLLALLSPVFREVVLLDELPRQTHYF